MNEIHNEAELNKFRFPIDKGLSEEEAELRLKIAMGFLRSVPHENLRSFKGVVRDRTIAAAFDWADAVLAFMQVEVNPTSSAHEVSE